MAVYAIFEPSDSTGFPRLVFVLPAAVFPLMALFIWIDISRYNAYLPLFTAGKCISLFSLLIWCVLRLTTAEGLYQAGAELILLFGDIFAMTGILLIYKYKDKFSKTHVLEGNNAYYSSS